MNAQRIENTHREITELIDRKELKKAIARLSSMIRLGQDWQADEELKRWETTYKYMLLYFSKGNPDPERTKVYNELIVHLYKLVDITADEMLLKESPSYFFDRKRYLNYSVQISPAQLERQIEKLVSEIALTDLIDDDKIKLQKISTISHSFDNDLSVLFLQVWLSDRFKESDREHYAKLIESETFPVEAICLLVSGLTLSLFRRFDEAKCVLLIKACLREHEEVRQRALVGLLLVFFLYQKRIEYYPEVAHHFEVLAERPGMVTDLQNIILHLIRSRETEKISRKMTDEILPEMMKISPILRKKMNLEDWKQDGGDEGKNPDWQEVFEQAGLEEKMKEMGRLQMEGSDIFMTTFAGLKSFPFFYNISNWFLPFNTHHSAFLDMFSTHSGIDSGMLGVIMKSGILCNSDKYSLGLSLLQMPASQRDMVANQFLSENQEIDQMQAEEALLQDRKKGDTIAKQYIQDLYRFFKLHPHRADFYDVFGVPMHFHKLPFVKPLLSGNDSLRIIAEFFFNKEFYADALDVFIQLSESDAENSELYQKIGYCHQLLDNDKAALMAYLRADVIFPDSAWTIRRIAQCYRRLKQPELALEYYMRFDKISPDNLNVILNIGHCYLEKKDYNEALRYYFKADYIDNSTSKSWRPIAWCSFLAGKFEQAELYYQKIAEQSPSSQDWMNIGHISWCMKLPEKALDCYLKSISLIEGGFEKFRDNFAEDEEELLMAGLTHEELRMMLDQIQYSLDVES